MLTQGSPKPLCSHHRPLSTGSLNRPAVLLQLGDQQVAVVALDLNHAVAHRAAGAAFFLQRFGQLIQFFADQRHAGDDGHTLALAPLGFAADAHHSVTRRGDGLRRRASALRIRPARGRTFVNMGVGRARHR